MSTTMHKSLKSGIYLKVFLEISVEYYSTYPSANFKGIEEELACKKGGR
jgi:hypothetical protein